MDEIYTIVIDVLSKNNSNSVVDIRNKINDIIQLLHDNNKNKIAINLLKQITITMDLIIKTIGDNSSRLITLLKNLDNIKNQINSMNSKFEKLIKNRNYGTKYYGDAKYVGELKNGIREGKGVLYLNDGNRYEGEFKNDKKEGKGIYYWNSGLWKGDRYEGDWKNNNKDGKGIYYFSNGNKYDGDWKNDKFEGKGIYYFTNGNRYEGDWKNDKKDGKGVWYWSDGDRAIGDFKDGEAIGLFAKLCKNGEIKTLNLNKYHNV